MSVDAIQDFISSQDVSALETQNSVLAITVGLVFIGDSVFGGTLYDRFPDTYRYISFMPSWFWGGIFTVAGTIHLLTLYIGVRQYRKHILFVKGGLWLALALIVIKGDVSSFGGYIYIIFSLSAFVCYIRLWRKPHYVPLHQSR